MNIELSIKAVLQGTTSLNLPLDANSDCVLPISVGWDYHEGDYFHSTLMLVENKFSSCRIVVCDTLQQYTLQFLKTSLNPSESIEQYARHLGDEWIDRHLKAIERMSINWKIERWDDCKSVKEYDFFQKELEGMITDSGSLSSYFYQTAEHIYNNFKIHGRFSGVDIKKEDFIKESIAYLIEECAVVLAWKKLEEKVLLYPKNLGEALHQTMNTFWGGQRDFLQPLQIKFKKKNIIRF